MTFLEWASKWGIAPDAISDYYNDMTDGARPAGIADASESRVQSEIMLEAPRKGCRLFRNNVGVLTDKTGRPVRFGLMNESKAQNEQFKSCDLIGIRPLLIEQAHVGTVVGQFLAREVKQAGWRYSGNAHEKAQLNFIELIRKYGGDAQFANDTGTI